MSTKPNDKNLHAGHRQRMMERYRKFGFDGFQPHEVVEVLLFQVLPRVNTNIHGHRLINAFGSLKNLLEADREDLEKVYGIGPASADFLASSRETVSEKLCEQFYGAKDLCIFQLSGLADWFMRDEERPVGMILYNEEGCFVDFLCLPIVRHDDNLDVAEMFSRIEYDITNYTFSLFVKPENMFSESDIDDIRRYTFLRSIILDEVYVMNKRQPVPTLHPYSLPREIENQ